MDTLDHFETIRREDEKEIQSSDCWFHRDRDEEKEETLSLSDLPLYGDDWEQDLSSQGSASFSSSEDDFFEFFSQEPFNPSHPGAGIPPENIIFCGKLIPYKQPYCDAKSRPSESRRQEAHKDQDFGVSRWKFGGNSDRYIDFENDQKIAIPPKKVKGTGDLQVRTSSSSGKAKWYLLYFGISRFSSTMELNGVNSRRSSRQYQKPSFRFGMDGRDRGWRMEGLIGALSCGGHRRADTMVAASIGRPPLK